MRTIAFIDTEIEKNSGKVLDLGGIKEDGSSFHSVNGPTRNTYRRSN